MDSTNKNNEENTYLRINQNQNHKYALNRKINSPTSGEPPETQDKLKPPIQSEQQIYSRQNIDSQQAFNNQQMNTQQIVNNQVAPQINVFIFDPEQLKLDSANITCPYCHRPTTTRLYKRCDCCNLLCCLLSMECFCLPWICLQCCRGKNLSCYSASHYCGSCGGFLREYHAC